MNSNSTSHHQNSGEWATNVMNDLSLSDRQTVFDMWRAIRMADQAALQEAVRNFDGQPHEFERLVAGVGAMRHFIEDDNFSLAVVYGACARGGKLAVKLNDGRILRSNVLGLSA